MKLKVKNDLWIQMMDFMKIFSVVMVFPSDALLEEMFKESDDEHDRDPHGHPEKLEDETDQISSLRFTLEWVGVTRGELRHHVHQGLDIGRHWDICINYMDRTFTT